jgi:hypothetical protein
MQIQLSWNGWLPVSTTGAEHIIHDWDSAPIVQYLWRHHIADAVLTWLLYTHVIGILLSTSLTLRAVAPDTSDAMIVQILS